MSDLSSSPIPPALPEALPDALRPHLNPGKPNEAIPVYTGPISVSQTGNTVRTDATISLRWLPSPALYLVIERVPVNTTFQLGEFSLRLNDGTEAPQCFFTSLPMFFRLEDSWASATGIINGRIVRPADGPVSYVMFLLPNFIQPIGRGVRYPDGSGKAVRLTLSGGGWIITLDAADDQKNVEQHLKANSGFGITQVGRLEKEDRSSFSAEDAQSALDALAWYVSFAAGQRTGPCLPTGFDAGGKQAWEVWGCSRTAPFRSRESWLDHCHRDQFEEPFPGFMKLWRDDTWTEVIRLAIHWYIEANAQAGSIEGSIVLIQTAFELLASAVLTYHNWFSQGSYDKIDAADRIRLLFLWAGIPTGIPSELGALVKLAKSREAFMVNKTPDAAAAMTTIRNTIVHPTLKNRKRFEEHSHEARYEAWTLGLHLLELCLLRLFEYKGTFANRITQKWQGGVETVPWR